MLALDHIVIADKNIELATEQFSEDFSLAYVKGGQHSNWGTYNFLAYLSNDCYIEWLGVNNDVVAKKSSNPLVVHLQYILTRDLSGSFQFALRTNNLYSYVIHFKKNNIPFFGPLEGRRRTPSGDKLKWKMLFPTYDVKKTMLPFLIEWETPLSYRPMNEKEIKLINYSGINIDKFSYMYKIERRKIEEGKINLENCQLQFTNNKMDFFTFTFE